MNDSQTILRIITEKNEAIILNLLLEMHDNYWFNGVYTLCYTVNYAVLRNHGWWRFEVNREFHFTYV